MRHKTTALTINATLLIALAAAALPAHATSPTLDTTTRNFTSDLPHWATGNPATGKRTIWIQPIHPQNHKGWDKQKLLNETNKTLTIFATESRGLFTVTATKVLPPIIYPEVQPGQNPCNATVPPRTQSALKAQTLPQDTHLMNILPEVNCPFSGLGAVPGNLFEIFDITAENDLADRSTVVHEFAHNLGLPHAFAHSNTYLHHETTRPGSEIIEYGDAASIMGNGHPHQTDAFTPVEKTFLGWNPNIEHVTNGQVTLTSSRTAEQRSFVTTDTVDGTRYLLSYLTNSYGTGIIIHEINDRGTRNRTLPALTIRHYYRPLAGRKPPGMQPGDTWTSPAGGIHLTAGAADADSAQLSIHSQAEATKDTEGPQIPADPEFTIRNKKIYVDVWAGLDATGMKDIQIRIRHGAHTQRFTLTPSDFFSYQLPKSVQGQHRPNTRKPIQITVRYRDTVGNHTLWRHKTQR